MRALQELAMRLSSRRCYTGLVLARKLPVGAATQRLRLLSSTSSTLTTTTTAAAAVEGEGHRADAHASSADRGSSRGRSLDAALLATEPELVLRHLRARRSAPSLLSDVSRVAALRAERSASIAEGDAAKSQRKALSAQIGQLVQQGSTVEAAVSKLKAEVSAFADVATKCNARIAAADTALHTVLSSVPNLLCDSVPDGSDASHNVQVKVWEPSGVGLARKVSPEGDGTYAWHDELLHALGANGADPEAAARISGGRFSVLCGHTARLERALLAFFLDFQAARGYAEVSVPYIVTRSALEGTGQLPKFEEDLFRVSHQVAGEDAFLIPTAEVPVTNLLRGQLLDAAELPLKYVCGSPAFRAEAGSAGRDTRGLLRQHQFHKAELVKVVHPSASEREHAAMVADAEAVLEALQLPYRTVLLCSGDIGFAARKCYDLEVWLPGQQQYREVASVSNCHDFQARRMGLRFRTQKQGASADKKGKSKSTAYPHTLNGSGVAVGRALAAILENGQQADGSVLLPEVLHSYMGGVTTLRAPSAAPTVAETLAL